MGEPGDPDGGGGGIVYPEPGYPDRGVAVTEPDGTYRICGLPPGDSLVHAWAEGYLGEMQRYWFGRAIGILDIFHVSERIWAAAHCFHAKESEAARQFATHHLRMTLDGKVSYVLRNLRRLLEEKKKDLAAKKRKTLRAAITYFENNQDHMRYDEYLAAGYPIGSGVAEGACRHLVKDRLELTGMRWERKGAQSMLHLRAIYLNGEWDQFVNYRIETEQAALYGPSTVYGRIGVHAQAA